MDSPPFDLRAYQPPLSLWKLVQQHVPEHEREEIKSMLGESLIDQSLELHEEVDTLLEIWRDYRDETSRTQPASRLPEPPGLRDRLVQEIQFFVGSLKEKARHQGVNADKFLSRHNTEVLDYALESARPDSARPSSRLTARGNDGRETPMICSPACSDRTSEASVLSEEVEAMNDKLNVLKFDEVVAHLRETLEEEIETLLRDIGFLQNCLDEEATFRAEVTGTLSREPTLTDLKEERSTLEKDLLSNMSSQTSPPLIKPAFTPPTVLKKLGPTSLPSNSRKLPSQGDTGLVAVKNGPMKAFSSHEQSNIHTAGEQRLKSEAQTKTLPGSSVVHSHHTSSAKLKSTQGISSRMKTVTDQNAHVHRHEHSGSMGVKPKSPMGNSIRNVSEDTSFKISHRELSPSRAKLEAVVTLSKGMTGDATDVHVMPSPPSSAKPTTPRPSSAQRFRKMVLECRDTS